MKLRDYQKECILESRKAVRKGLRRGLVALPTGTGKTVVFSHYPKIFEGRMLVLAHREELLDQAARTIKRVNPRLRVEVDQADRLASTKSDVVVASVQTLRRDSRLARYWPDFFSVVVVDEAHHTPAPSYLKILHYFGLAPDPKGAPTTREGLSDYFQAFRPAKSAPALFGYTATPSRTDNQGLEYIYDDMVFSRTMPEMMTEGWLCPIHGIQVQTAEDISDVKTTAGDFNVGQLGEAVNTPSRNRLAVKAYRDYGEGRPAIAFTVDVDHTKALCRAFQKAGYAAEYVVGESRPEDREEAISDFKSGRLDVLVNCMVLTEGFDAPETSCLIMARPTKSQLLYTQMIGRGTRIHPDKDDLLVIDLVDVSKVGIPTLNTLFGLPPKLKLDETDALTARQTLDELESQVPMYMLGDVETLDDVRTMSKEIDTVKAAQVEEWLQTTLVWTKTSYGYGLSLGAGTYVGVLAGHLGRAQLRVKRPNAPYESLGWYPNAQLAISAGEAWVAASEPEKMALVHKAASWRKQPPSDKQLGLAKQLGIRVLPSMTKGDVSEAITQRIEQNRANGVLRPPVPNGQLALPMPRREPENAAHLTSESAKRIMDDLVWLYERQTEDERSGEYTKHDNGVGFNAFDAQLGSSLAQQIQMGRTLTLKQVLAAERLVRKYTGQLSERPGRAVKR